MSFVLVVVDSFPTEARWSWAMQTVIRIPSRAAPGCKGQGGSCGELGVLGGQRAACR